LEQVVVAAAERPEQSGPGSVERPRQLAREITLHAQRLEAVLARDVLVPPETLCLPHRPSPCGHRTQSNQLLHLDERQVKALLRARAPRAARFAQLCARSAAYGFSARSAWSGDYGFRSATTCTVAPARWNASHTEAASAQGASSANAASRIARVRR